MKHTQSTLIIAAVLYTSYINATGGVSAVTGQPLPSFEEMKADPSKQGVVDAWCATAEAASNLPLTIVAGQPGVSVPDGTYNPESEKHRQILVLENKAIRQRLDSLVEELKHSRYKSGERTLAMREIQSARHWLGEDLGNNKEPYPYPKGNDAKSVEVDPASDKHQAVS